MLAVAPTPIISFGQPCGNQHQAGGDADQRPGKRLDPAVERLQLRNKQSRLACVHVFPPPFALDYRKGDAMSFVLAVNIRIKPENVEAFMKKLADNASAARKEPGCKQFDVLVDPKDKTKVMLYEIYNDEKAFEAHQQTPHFKKYVAEAVPLLASRERQVFTRV
jgi:quinol monooxygenase YgiN